MWNGFWLVDSASAIASGTISWRTSSVDGEPPRRVYTWPEACAVSTRIAMLNSVRYGGFGLPFGWLNVDGVNAQAPPTIIPACGPRRISAAMSTTYRSEGGVEGKG